VNLTAAEHFRERIRAYTNTAQANDRLHAEFTALTAADPLLAGHRRHVEEHRLGFGDSAFHAMWRGLLALAHEHFGPLEVFEIGIFKGQVISLWALLARHYGWRIRIHAIGPLAGQPLPANRWWRSLLYRLSPRFRERAQTGSFHPTDDYEQIVRRHFAHHGLSFDDIRLVHGYSTAPEVLAAVEHDRFHIGYIDGDHTFEVASADLANFAPKIVPGGWLVMDDAAFELPGTTFWKGYPSVAQACRVLPALGFENVINIGHNCIFRRRD
jgi:predicted O-methyltransferase YrrM